MRLALNNCGLLSTVLRIPMRGYEEQEKAKDAIKDALRIPMRGYEISVEQ